VVVILISLPSPELPVERLEVPVFEVVGDGTVDVRNCYVDASTRLEDPVPFGEDRHELVSSKMLQNMGRVNFIHAAIFERQASEVRVNIGRISLDINIYVPFQISVPTTEMELHNDMSNLFFKLEKSQPLLKMAVHVVNPRLGFGNVLVKLVDFIEKAPGGRVDENLKDFERGRAFNFNVKFTKDEPHTFDGDLYCGPEEFSRLTAIIPSVMSPTVELLNLFQSKVASLEGVEVGIHIRCGSAMPDCKGLSASHGGDWFASVETLRVIDNIVASSKFRVFLASDSKEVKSRYKKLFGDKVVVFDTDITLTCDPETCGGVTQSSQGLMDAYLEWFTLSRCPTVFTTAGPGFDPTTTKGAGISTFGYTAAAYGQRPLYVVDCNGQVGQCSL
jgi:hypothetical protein